MKKNTTILLAMALCFQAAFADTKPIYKIWNGRDMPGNVSMLPESQREDGKEFRPNVVRTPYLEFFKAESEGPTGLVIVCPGGGYSMMAYQHEGIEIAEALVKNGISAAVLAYRVPENRDGALMDAQRAIRYVRAHAKDFNINPDKVAIMGFSAGANLSARASTQFDAVAYKAADAIDKFSAKPNLTGLIYPAYCDNQNFEKRWYGIRSDEQAYDKKYALAPDLKISKDTPPAFLVETQPDPYVDASIAYYLALKKAGIPACLHLFDKGKHGYGLRNKTDLVSQWFDLYVKWLKHNGL